MVDKEYEELMKKVVAFGENELKNINADVDEIIKSNYKEEGVISRLFDRLINLEYVDNKTKTAIFYKLNRYTLTFNKELAIQYQVVFVEKNSKNVENTNNFSK